MTRNLLFVIGPALGGAIVVATGPGTALLIDACSFVLAALLLARIALPPRATVEPRKHFLHDLREGWREFTARSWLWASVTLIGIGNVFFMFWIVLGPTVAKDRLGGAGAWATILAANGLGAVVGGAVAYRIRPQRPLVACVLWPTVYVVQLAALAAGGPTWLVAIASFFAGLAIAVHLTLWFTILQSEVPERAQSRVSSYDALGSFVLTPLGTAAAGVIAGAIGTDSALWLAAGAILVTNTSILLVPSVWTIRRREAATTLAA
jgi:hypothetical protein